MTFTKAYMALFRWAASKLVVGLSRISDGFGTVEEMLVKQPAIRNFHICRQK